MQTRCLHGWWTLPAEQDRRWMKRFRRSISRLSIGIYMALQMRDGEKSKLLV